MPDHTNSDPPLGQDQHHTRTHDRWTRLLAGVLVFLSALGAMAASASACGGGAEPTTLTTSLSGESKEGETITVLEGSAVKDKATLSGTNASKATGTVKYNVYADKECKTLIMAAGEVTVTSGSIPASTEETLPGGASYYWQAYYSGDSNNSGSLSTCGKEIATVKSAAPTASEQLGGDNEASLDISPCLTGETIDCATGNLTEEQTDISIGGLGPGLRVTRTYNALAAAEATAAGAWGYGWTGPYSSHLEVNAATGTATVYQENGSAVLFYKSGSTYAPQAWVQATLAESGSTYIYTLPDQTQLEFNSEGRLVKETERNGNSITLTYNGSNQLEKATDGDGRALTFKYNGGGQVESVTDPMSHVVSYTYSSENLASVTIEGKARWEFEYESPHLLKKITDGRKDATTIEYDASHRAIKQVRAEHTRKLQYGATPGTETKLTEPNSSETVEKFNAAGQPTTITRASGVSGVETTTEYEYNGTYELVKLTDPNKHISEYGYNSTGDKTSEKDPSKDESKWTFDKTHDTETETTPEGETTTIKRNAAGDPEVIERPINSEVQKAKYKYAADGEVEEEVNPLGNTTKYTYDAAGDKKSEIEPGKNERTWEYNEDSQETSEVNALGNNEGAERSRYTTTVKRDEQGLPTKITVPLGHTTEYKYDGDDDLESEIDGNSHTTKYVYNEEDLPTKVEEANGDHPETEYDSEGKVTVHTDGNGHKWEYKRNKLEQVAEEINPLGQTTKRTYEKAGHVASLEDPEKHITTVKYDESNRPKEVEYSTGTPSTVTFEYNKDSQVAKMTDETGTTTNTYDKLGRLTEYKNGAGDTVKYVYSLDNEPTKITYPNGKEVTREYDKDGRLEKVTDWNSKVTKFTYNLDSDLTATTFPSETGDKDENRFNEEDQLVEVKMLKGAESLGKLVYSRGKDAEVTKTVTTVLPGPESSEDKYDEDNRLTESAGSKYEYDDANNPTKIEGAGPYTYNEADELKEGPENTYAYSEDGQRHETKPTDGEPTTTYSYDQAGNLTAVKRSKGTKLAEINDSYKYDGDNLRQGQTIGGATTNLTWDTAEPTPIVLSDETNSYIYGPENLPIEQISSGGETLYLHHDQQGSTRLLTNSKGETVTAYTYNPYGVLTNSTGTATTPLRYDGQYTNSDTGLIYLRARTYEPQTAQFLDVDPMEITTGAPYTYASDNPLNASDPDGLSSHGICGQAMINLGPMEVGVSLCAITSVRDYGVTVSIPFGLGLDRNIVERIGVWIRERGSFAGVTQLLRGSVSVGYQYSNARTICQLAGPFRATRGTLGYFLSGTYEPFWDATNTIRGATYSASYSPGLNLGGGDGFSYTAIAYSSVDGLCPLA